MQKEKKKKNQSNLDNFESPFYDEITYYAFKICSYGNEKKLA